MDAPTLRERLRRIVEALPPGAAATLPRDTLAEWVDADDPAPLADLTVQEVADLMGRKPSTVRGWCASGELRAYRLAGREWRIPHGALREYQDQQANPVDDDGDENIRGWRDM